MKIYRIENENHQGMYSGGSSAGDLLQDTESKHPLPYNDDALMSSLEKDLVIYDQDYDGLQFAFRSKSQLKRWVYSNKIKQSLKDEGYQVAVLEVPVAAVGDTQVIFDYDTATEIERLDITTI